MLEFDYIHKIYIRNADIFNVIANTTADVDNILRCRMFDYGNLPVWARWVCFIPALFVSALIMYLMINFIFEGLSQYVKNETLFYILSRVAFNLMGVFFIIFSSISMIPKGKIILASIYLGIIILSMGFSLTSYFFLNNGEYSLWQLIYEAVLTIAAGIIALVYTIHWERDQKIKVSKTTYTY